MDTYMQSLKTMLADEYAFIIQSISPAKRGFFGETWKIETDKGNYFVKIDYWKYHQESYRKSLFVIAYMNECGIPCIPKIQWTVDGCVYCFWNEGMVSVSEYIEGENREDYPVRDLFERLSQIYQLETQDLNLDIEDFSMDVWTQYQQLIKHPQLSERIINALKSKEERIDLYKQRLQQLSEKCKIDSENLYITHGDAGGNCIVSEYDFHIIDWDSVKIAPMERDVWFHICDDQRLEEIQEIIYENGINYKLKKEYLCYYCYYSFFYYITEYLKSYISAKEEIRKQELEDSMEEYLNQSWIFNQLKKAEKWMQEVMI